MGGFFGAVSANDCIQDVFFGTDYHSHLGTRRGGMTSYSAELGFQRNIRFVQSLKKMLKPCVERSVWAVSAIPTLSLLWCVQSWDCMLYAP